MDATRFDAAARTLAQGLPRRRFMGLFAGLAGLFLPSAILPAAATTGFTCTVTNTCSKGQCKICQIAEDGNSCACVCQKCGTVGIAGGGSVAVGGEGEAHVALLATRQPVGEEEDVFSVVGQVRWTDPGWEGSGLTLASTVVSFYGPMPDVENGREMLGSMQSPEQPGDFPFVLHAIAAIPGALGTATVALWVGDAILDDPAVAGTFDPAPERSGFGYASAGALATGDLQLLSLAAGSDGGPPATPAL